MCFACGACSQYNAVNVAKDTFYVITAGTSVGVFRNAVSSLTISLYPHNEWLMNILPLQALADSFVTGVKCSVRKKYSSLEAALSAFQVALNLETVKLLQKG
jgi:hypothetical protein